MSKDIAYFRSLPYKREWIPCDDESGRYLVVRTVDIPEIYGIGDTKAEGLSLYFEAFDDQIVWMLEEGLEIPEPAQPTGTEVSRARLSFSESGAPPVPFQQADCEESRSAGREIAFIGTSDFVLS